MTFRQSHHVQTISFPELRKINRHFPKIALGFYFRSGVYISLVHRSVAEKVKAQSILRTRRKHWCIIGCWRVARADGTLLSRDSALPFSMNMNHYFHEFNNCLLIVMSFWPTHTDTTFLINNFPRAV